MNKDMIFLLFILTYFLSLQYSLSSDKVFISQSPLFSLSVSLFQAKEHTHMRANTHMSYSFKCVSISCFFVIQLKVLWVSQPVKGEQFRNESARNLNLDFQKHFHINIYLLHTMPCSIYVLLHCVITVQIEHNWIYYHFTNTDLSLLG